MKHLPLSVAGALLLAGSMAVYAQAQQPPKEPMTEEQKPAQGGAGKQQQPQTEAKPKEEQGERAKGGQSGQSDVKPGKDNQRTEQSEKNVKPEGAGKPGNDQAGSSGGSATQEKPRAEKSGDGAKGESSKKRHAGKKLEAKQRTVVRESIGKRNVRPTRVNFSINVGTIVPRTVVLYDLPDTLIEYEPEYRRYKFILSDDNTILVIDPETWEIVDVIEI